jgi:alkylhydroperoxidase/carboxymuconolactone decarboxylase family protein YurZ
MKAVVARQEAGARPQDVYGEVFGDDANWMDAFAKRQAHLEGGKLSRKMRALIFVVGFLVNRYPDATRVYQAQAKQAGASAGDFRLLLKFMDFYRGLRGFQDAQRLVSFWKTGLFPEIRPPHDGKTDEIFAEIVATRKYIANGFRVYGADGEWLRLYLQRSNAIKKSPTTLDEREIQILSLAITLKNHGYSDNFNDGCIEVHELKAKALGAGNEETLEIVQIMELCDSMTTAWEGQDMLELAV